MPGLVYDLTPLLPILRSPVCGTPLRRADGRLETVDGSRCFPLTDGVFDLRFPPTRLRIDVPWFEPWEEIDSIELTPPRPLTADGLPYHLDANLAAIPGESGNGRRILEIGCGERQCEDWFVPRGFEYVGTDVDVRGRGPHLLADAHNLPFIDGAFDFYTSMAVYEHLVSPLTAALEAYRVLKPGGVFFGSAAFVYGFHDRASFHHMTHGGLFWMLRSVGFEVERMWPDWDYPSSIAEMAFPGNQGLPWRVSVRALLKAADWSFTTTSSLARRVFGSKPLKASERNIHTAGSVSFLARRPA